MRLPARSPAAFSQGAKRGFTQVAQQRSGRYAVRYTTPSGIRVSAGKTFARKADAEAWAADKRRQIDRGAKAAREKITFSAYATTWLANRHVKGRPIKPRTRAPLPSLLDDHSVPTFGNRQLHAIAPADVRGWHAVTLADKPTPCAATPTRYCGLSSPAPSMMTCW
jgi:hypothetical protein